MLHKSNPLRLSDYDFYGFDLDHTIINYNIKNLMLTSYSFLSDYLVKNFSYDLTQGVTSEDLNFTCRGLFLDLQRGNTVKATRRGYILKASHGTQPLSADEIVHTYGTDRRLRAITSCIENKFFRRREERTNVFPCFDMEDLAFSLIFAKAIDVNPHRPPFLVWRDIVYAIFAMYSDRSTWGSYVRENIQFFAHRTNRSVINWLKLLRNYGYTALITSSPPESANRSASYALGPNWKDLFHFLVFDSQKPHFFTSKEPFKTPIERQPIWDVPLNLDGGEYCGGSYYMIEQALKAKLGRKPKTIYFGDSPVADLYQTVTDRVAVVGEAMVEGFFPGNHRHEPFLKSDFWGSIFNEGSIQTYMGDIIRQTKFCAPDLDYFSQFPINHAHIPFWDLKLRKRKF